MDIPEFEYCDILHTRIEMEKPREPHSVSLKGGEVFPKCLPDNADKRASLAVTSQKPHSIVNTNPVQPKTKSCSEIPFAKTRKRASQDW